VRFRPAGPRRVRTLAPIAASAAVVAVVGGIALFNAHSGPSALAGGDPTSFAQSALSGVPNAGPDDYVHEVDAVYRVRDDGSRIGAAIHPGVYAAANGDVVELDSGPGGSCTVFKHSGDPSPTEPTAAYLAALPTDPNQLADYLLNHVHGSTSKDEAVFVAVDDMLRNFDGFASPRLKAAMVDVLSRSHLVTVHSGVDDDFGRPAIRVDFMDQARRPGELTSLYFDPTSFQLLERRDGSNGRPGPEPGPSFPYSATPTNPGSTTDVLSGPANIELVTTEVVRHMPYDANGCTVDNG
jgi:hypothetical protein